VALLACRGSYAVDTLVAYYADRLGELSGATPSGYALRPAERPRTIAVASDWMVACRRSGEDGVAVLRGLRERATRLVALDQADPFQLDFPPEEISLFDAIIKVNGVYRHPRLYSLQVGAPSARGDWTSGPPRDHSYDEALLERVHLGPCCLLASVPAVRARVRSFYVRSRMARAARRLVDLTQAAALSALRRVEPTSDVFFLATLSHIQRADAARALRSAGFSGRIGIVSVPEYITGLGGKLGLVRLGSEARADLRHQLAREGLLARPLRRPLYLAALQRSRAVVSITGYGEVCFRMAEALACGRLLVCQDLSHVRTRLPLRDRENVLFCRSDLADLADVVAEARRNAGLAERIANQGHADWHAFCDRADAEVAAAFAPLWA